MRGFGLLCRKVMAVACVGAGFVLGAPVARAALLAGFDFQTTTSGGTAIAAAPNTPRVFAANIGAGTLYLDGTHGSSPWVTTLADNEATAGVGTTANTTTGFSATTGGAAALTLLGGTGVAANGKSFVFAFSMAGYEKLSFSYATVKTNNGFSTQRVEWSRDGQSWTLSQSTSALSLSYANIGFSSFAGLDGAATAYVRVTLSGAVLASGLNRFDNVQILATPQASVAGDYNGDGYVDAADYTVWADSFGRSGTGLTADGNRDGVVDAADYTIWADHFGQGTPPGRMTSPVPEPAGAGAAIAAGLAVLRRRRR